MRTNFCRCPSGGTRRPSHSGAISKPIAQRRPPAATMSLAITACAWPKWCATTACRSAPRRPPTAGRPTDEPNLRFVALVVPLIFLDVLVRLHRLCSVLFELDMRAPLRSARFCNGGVDLRLRLFQSSRNVLADMRVGDGLADGRARSGHGARDLGADARFGRPHGLRNRFIDLGGRDRFLDFRSGSAQIFLRAVRLFDGGIHLGLIEMEIFPVAIHSDAVPVMDLGMD